LRKLDEDSNEYTRNQVYQEGPRSDGKLSPKTRDLSPWFGRENTTMAAFSRPYGGATCRSSTHGLVSSSRTLLYLYI